MKINLHNKIKWSIIAGAVVTVIVWILSLLGVDMPGTVAAALVLILSNGAGYQAANEGTTGSPQTP